MIKDGQSVGGTSIMGLMTLAAAPGCTIELQAEGREAEAALDALAGAHRRRLRRRGLEHDPEKWHRIADDDHAPATDI